MGWDSVVFFQWLALVLLVLVNGFFVAAEFAVVRVRDTQLDAMVARGHPRALRARAVVADLDGALSATQLGITLASLGLGWVAEPAFAALLEPLMSWLGIESAGARETIAIVVGFTAISFLHIVAGELAPKSLAIQRPLPTTLAVARPLALFHRLSYPAIVVLNRASALLLRLAGVEPASEAERVHSEEELRLLVTESARHGGGAPLSRAIVLNAFDLRQRYASDVMRPRQEIVVLSTDATYKDCLARVEGNGYSRYPLCEDGDIDRPLGVVHYRHVFGARRSAQTGRDLLRGSRALLFVPANARLDAVLQQLLEKRLHVAFVVDEYGGTMGLVSLEDVLEEVVGEIRDEREAVVQAVVPIDDHTWVVMGAVPLYELESDIGLALPEDEGVVTLSGWLTKHFGGFPVVHERVTVGDFSLVVEEMEGMLVAKVRVVRSSSDSDSSG